MLLQDEQTVIKSIILALIMDFASNKKFVIRVIYP